ncbi:MAG: hypothetical protein WKF43_10520 [Acidimicrobiales bacterium]
MPAAVLVVIVLGAIAIDQSVVFIHHRDLVAGAEAAANDAATFGIDQGAFYDDGSISYDSARTYAAARAALELRQVRVRSLDVSVSADGERLVVTLISDAESIFAKAIPGAPSRTTVTATASARLLQD